MAWEPGIEIPFDIPLSEGGTVYLPLLGYSDDNGIELDPGQIELSPNTVSIQIAIVSSPSIIIDIIPISLSEGSVEYLPHIILASEKTVSLEAYSAPPKPGDDSIVLSFLPPPPPPEPELPNTPGLRSLYVDANALVVGDGTQESPFTFPQLRNYLNPNIGQDCNTVPQNGDNVLIKGIVNDYIDDAEVFVIRRNLAGSITLKSWDLANNGIWLIETQSYSPSNQVKLFTSVPEHRIQNIEVKDFALLHNSGGSENVVAIGAEPDSLEKEMSFDLKNFMIYSERDVDLSAPQYVDVVMSGFTVKGDVVNLLGMGDIYLKDGGIKANQIVDA